MIKRLIICAAVCFAARAFAQDGGGAAERPKFDWEDFMPGEYDGSPIEVEIPGVEGGPFCWVGDSLGEFHIEPQTFDPGVDAALAVMGELMRLDSEFKDLRGQYEGAIKQIDAVTKDLRQHEKTSVTVTSSSAHTLGGGATDYMDLVSGFRTSADGITVYSHALGFTDGLLTISGAGTPFPLPLAKVATSGALKDVSGWPNEKAAIEAAYTAADTQVKEDLTNIILSYHPPEEGVPDEATNILAKVAFDGDYNSLTNTPEIVVEEAEGGEGGEGGAKTYVFRLKAGGGASASNQLALAAIATSGAWGDLRGIPDAEVTLVKAVEAGTAGVTVTTASYCITTNGLVEVEGSARATGPTSVCGCEGGDSGGGDSGGDGGDGDGDGGGDGNCNCQIKTAAHVNAAEVDPEAIPRVEALESRMTKVEDDLATASQRLNALCEYLGKNPIPGDMNRPPDFDND